MNHAIVLAAGAGTRMRSNLTKVMHPLFTKPMIGYVVDNLKAAGIDDIVVVVGHQAEKVKAYLKDQVRYATQDEVLGTGHAVGCAKQLSDADGATVVMYGDCPLVRPQTIQALITEHHKSAASATLISAVVENPAHYSRIVRNIVGDVERIINFGELNEAQRTIHEINTGIYCFDNQQLFTYLPRLSDNNSQHEYELSEVISLMTQDHLPVRTVKVADVSETIGVNNTEQLVRATKWLQNEINQKHLDQGVTLIDPKRTMIGPDVVLGKDTVIYPNCYLLGDTQVAAGSVLYPDCWLEHAHIGRDCAIIASRITDSEVGDNTTVGPYAHLRMNTVLGADSRVGNFVEMKNTQTGTHTRSAHLTYLGDAQVGTDVNFGCGVVTVNYDGKNKSKTTIGNHSFIGSNANLVAPITIGDYAVVAAGSTISDDVADEAMVIERSKPVVKPGSGKKYIKK